MFKIRVKFSKEEDLKFLSHLDLVKTIKRIIRRAEIPFVITSGFSPDLKISFSPALAVGICSSSEFFELSIYKKLNEEEIKNRLSSVSVEGIKILKVEYVPLNSSLLSRLSFGEYEVEANFKNLDEEKIKKFLTQQEIILKKTTKKGEKLFDLKKLILKFDFKIKNEIVLFDLIISLNISPQEVFKIPYFDSFSLEILKINRKALYYEENGKIIPLI